ncbi:MAG: NUDIX domain-containing protein [Calditrichaeota bacterium]|nr:MAG: NUDIX domain-containing protein [Calditrichota bacterium]
MKERRYPDRPLLGVGAVVFKAGRILLVKRKHEPGASSWTLPGGLVELGETVKEAVKREVLEECGVEISPRRIVDAVDVIEKDRQGRVVYHYLLVDFEADYLTGRLSPASDAVDARWVDPRHLSDLNLPAITRSFLKKHYNL